jgi:Protein of unknown function (DUF3618)
MTTEPSDDADALRDDIAHTRADLADTVQALAAKTDVPARAKEAVTDLTSDAVRKGREAAEHVSDVAASLPGQLRSDVESVRDLVTRDGPEKPDYRPVARLAAIVAVVVGVIVWLGRKRRG